MKDNPYPVPAAKQEGFDAKKGAHKDAPPTSNANEVPHGMGPISPAQNTSPLSEEGVSKQETRKDQGPGEAEPSGE